MTTTSTEDEAPTFNKIKQLQLYKNHKPLRPPGQGTTEHNQLSVFCSEVEIILQTVSDSEYQAATVLMKPPSKKFARAVVFPSAGTVVGMFAGHKTALLHADAGANVGDYVEHAVSTFPNARFIIGVGAGYAFDREAYQLGDVLVSKNICDLKNLEINSESTVINHGETIKVVNELVSVFCKDLTFDKDFELSANRFCKVFAGDYLSYPAHMNNKEIRDKFHAAVPGAIGGDMEGGELLRFQQKGMIKGIIVIKGVAGYADGDRGEEWEFTAALAALKYTQSKLHYYQCQDKVSGALILESASITRYQQYLKSYYKLITADQLEDKFSIAPCDEFINLALIHKCESVSQEHAFFGVDEIVAFKTSVKLDDLVRLGSRFVLVEGPPGIGKSTMCWELCKKWDTLGSLQHFKIVLQLKLREERVQNANKLNEIFFHDDDELCNNVVKEVLECEGEGVLLIMDGFDEMLVKVHDRSSMIMKLICGKSLPKASLLVTSRPSALHLRSYFPKHCKHVVILGFTDQSKIDFARMAFKLEPDVLTHFMKLVYFNPITNSLMCIPIVCAIIVQVYKEMVSANKVMPKTTMTMTQLYTSLVLVIISKHRRDKREWGEDIEIPDLLEELPKGIISALKRVGELAYRGLFEKELQLVFYSSDVGKDFDHLGLLSVSKEMYVTKGAKTSYSFSHLTIQEFLAAWHVSSQPELISQYAKLFDDLYKLPAHLEIFVRFLAGMVGVNKLLLVKQPSWRMVNPLLLYCLFETQNPSEFITHLEENDNIPFSISSFLDGYVLGYALVHTPIQWFVESNPFSFEALVSSVLQHSQSESAILGSISKLVIEHSILYNVKSMPTCLTQFITYFVFDVTDACSSIDGISSGISSMHSLTHIDITLNSIGCHNYHKLFESIQALKGLKEMVFHLCKISEPGVQELLKSFSDNRIVVNKLTIYSGRRVKELVDSYPVNNFFTAMKYGDKIIKSALSCLRVRDFCTNIQFLIFKCPNSLKNVSYSFTDGWNSLHVTTNFFCRAVELCKLSSVSFTTLMIIPPKSYCILLSILNKYFHLNTDINWECIYSTLKPLKHYSLLSQALRKDFEVQRSNIWKSNSLCDLATSTDSALMKRSKSCPDLLELRSLRTLHPLLDKQLYGNRSF